MSNTTPSAQARWRRGGRWPATAPPCPAEGTDMEEGIRLAAVALEHGGVVVAPGDAVYGFFGHVFHAEAIDQVYEIKHRDRGKPFALCTSAEEVDKWAIVGPRERALIDHYWPYGLGLILPKSPNLPPHFSPDFATVAVMTASNYLIRGLQERTGPLFATTCNLAGDPEARTADDANAFLDRVALTLTDDGVFSYPRPTTLLDCTVDPPRAVRESAIPAAEVMAFLATLEK